MSVTSRPPTRVAENLALVRRFWDDLYAHEFDKVGAYFTAGAVYDDVPIPAARVVGPAAIVRKLRIGFARVERHTHHLHRMVADDETVVTEHTEDWHFALWRDYSNIDTLLSAAPSWWLQHVTASWAEG